MFKNALEESHAIAKIIGGISSLGKGPFWKRAIVYLVWGLFILCLMLGTPKLLQIGVEKHWNQYSNNTGDIGDRNSLMIAKDAVNLCLASIKSNHHYKERYCDYSILMFEQNSTRFGEFSQELVNAKAYEQMLISIDSDIRSLDFQALAKRHSKSLQERVLDLLFTPIGMLAYICISIVLLSLPLALFYAGSKSKIRRRYFRRIKT
ncbi:hypothetical protein [Vibrio parahaemolyticus]|uniref:hypothetical protein n=1 Tax=Vibrio parahaemolyticus TaxID=670 RepID=UPI001124C17D|nr:hypothetical protein [Vibrio parahaemolyticus]TOG57161.1 hypothetical protein CGI99_24420 [Vibrio parahaemolyticus]